VPTAASPIPFQRLRQQHLSGPKFNTPAEMVRFFGAVQAQDYLGSLWGIGLRLSNVTEAGVEQAVANKTIVRSWPMRNTLHFVAAGDLRWMLNLLGPGMMAKRAALHKTAELDQRVFTKCRKLVDQLLQGGQHLTRSALYAALEKKKIATGDQRGLHILAYLAQEGTLCFGPRAGKQHTFVLLDEWLPASKILHREEALGELARRYFTSHGPATLQDYTWWSGLPAADSRTGLAMVKSEFISDRINGTTYWMNSRGSRQPKPSIYLLPAYDEYTVAYKDRSAILDPNHAQQARNGIFNPVIVVNGQVTGSWQREFRKGQIHLDARFFSPPSGSVQELPLADYSRFLGMPVVRNPQN
jgi:hypothetical protein